MASEGSSTTTTPPASSPEARERFRRQRGRDTSPELRLRRLLHARGLRYRLHQNVLPELRRRHDIVFRPSRVVVEVRGCWWHGCPEHYRPPTSNRDWWERKIGRNRERDAATEQALRNAGWEVVVVWEHEDPESAAEDVAAMVRDRRPGAVSG